jgi:hypothetical protein
VLFAAELVPIAGVALVAFLLFKVIDGVASALYRSSR